MSEIEFKESPYVAGNLQCIKDNRHIASIDMYTGEAVISLGTNEEDKKIIENKAKEYGTTSTIRTKSKKV